MLQPTAAGTAPPQGTARGKWIKQHQGGEQGLGAAIPWGTAQGKEQSHTQGPTHSSRASSTSREAGKARDVILTEVTAPRRFFKAAGAAQGAGRGSAITAHISLPLFLLPSCPCSCSPQVWAGDSCGCCPTPELPAQLPGLPLLLDREHPGSVSGWACAQPQQRQPQSWDVVLELSKIQRSSQEMLKRAWSRDRAAPLSPLSPSSPGPSGPSPAPSWAPLAMVGVQVSPGPSAPIPALPALSKTLARISGSSRVSGAAQGPFSPEHPQL